ncbi:MAG: hypothetical protein KDK36_12685 [Leptospiraceae bacterium]|nr:hypothetical protein [Leptospiraceae bacterium]
MEGKKKNHIEIYLLNFNYPVIKINGNSIKLEPVSKLDYLLMAETEKTKFTVLLPDKLQNLTRKGEDK